MTLVEEIARAICYYGAYEDNYPDGPDRFTCDQCRSPADCKDWDVYSLSFEREAQAALSVILQRLREPDEGMVWAFASGVFKWEGKYMPTSYRELSESGLRALADHLEAK